MAIAKRARRARGEAGGVFGGGHGHRDGNERHAEVGARLRRVVSLYIRARTQSRIGARGKNFAP
jgi:hypothetical protein